MSVSEYWLVNANRDSGYDKGVEKAVIPYLLRYRLWTTGRILRRGCRRREGDGLWWVSRTLLYRIGEHGKRGREHETRQVAATSAAQKKQDVQSVNASDCDHAL